MLATYSKICANLETHGSEMRNKRYNRTFFTVITRCLIDE